MCSTRYSCQILIKAEFSQQIFENSQTLNLIKIRQVGAELFCAEGQTCMQTGQA